MGAEIPSWAGQREGVGGAGISRGKLVRKAPVSKRVSGACDADSSRCLFFAGESCYAASSSRCERRGGPYKWAFPL